MKVIKMNSPFQRERKQNIKQLKHLIDKYLPQHQKETVAKIKIEQ